MKYPILIVAALAGMVASIGNACAADYALSTAGPPPEELPAEIRQSLAGEGHRISAGDATLAEIWLTKSPALKQGFTPSLRVKYPFEVGALVGVLRVGDGEEVADFRDQPLDPGLYTLRYGQQPQDGNHIGTSQQADFLMAIPVGEDKSAGRIESQDELNELSAVAAGSTHPAIFSLQPIEGDKSDKAKLTHEAAHDFWILQTPGDEKRPALRLVVVGVGEE